MDHRKKEKQSLLDGIKQCRKNGERTHELLTSGEYDFVGFGCNLFYVKADGTKAMFVHPFGFPVLIYKHKHSCTLVMASNLIKYNEPIEGTEVSLDKWEKIVGVLG
jgi:hypothetical protein